MAGAGSVQVRIGWDGETVRSVDIESTRPQAYRLLEGQTPAQAVKMARMLFNVCGNAQGAAAAAAISAAEDSPLLDRAAMERDIACEAMQEHLWRLLLDWPKLLGLPQAQEDFVRWHGQLRSVMAGTADMTVVKSELEARWLGMASEAWMALKGFDALQAWWQNSASPAGMLLAALDHLDAEASQKIGTALLPNWTAEQAIANCGQYLDQSFSAQPHCQGTAAETGALSSGGETTPLLLDVLKRRPGRLLARVLARLRDTLQIAGAAYHGRLSYAKTADGAGVAVANTARGMLLHRVRLSAGLVREYLTVAPTEWNFHPQGALAAGLHGLQIADRSRLEHVARLQVLSLDPCVEYGIEISGAGQHA